MAQAGFTPIKLYLSTTAAAVPTAGNLAPGELAINNNDGKLFYEDSAGVVQVIATKAGASGNVVGPASATDNAVARYDGTTGKIIQNSVVTIADDGATVIAANSSSDGLRITQLGAGNALVVEDSANPDATPFVVNASGQVSAGFASNPATMFGSTPQLGVHTTGNDGIANYRAGNDVNGAAFIFQKTRGADPSVNTVVQSGDNLGVVYWTGADGTGYIRGAQIAGQVDGTPGTNDMPGRLVFSTTADGASSPTERMRIDNAGRVGIGGTAGASTPFFFKKSATGNATQYIIYNESTIQSDVTTAAEYFVARANLQNTAFTLPSLTYFKTSQAAFGSATVTNQYGFLADSSIVGATNNYGFYGDIASGTNRWNFYAAGTAANYFAGNVGIGVTAPSFQLDVQSSAGTPAINVATTASNESARLRMVGKQGATDNEWNIVSTGAFVAGAQLRFVAGGWTNSPAAVITSANVISLGAAPGSESLRVTPVASAVNYWESLGASTGVSPVFQAVGSDTNVNAVFATKGTGAHLFRTNGNTANTQFLVAHTASAVNYLQVTGNTTTNAPEIRSNGSDTNVALSIFTKGTGAISLRTDRDGTPATQFVVAHTASAVNYLQVTGGATANSVKLSAQGTDANIDVLITAKGINSTVFSNSGGSQFAVGYAASAVNLTKVRGSATGSPVVYGAAGTDANIDILLEPQGTGVLRFGTYTAGVVAQAGYITIKDAAGNVRRLLAG